MNKTKHTTLKLLRVDISPKVEEFFTKSMVRDGKILEKLVNTTIDEEEGISKHVQELFAETQYEFKITSEFYEMVKILEEIKERDNPTKKQADDETNKKAKEITKNEEEKGKDKPEKKKTTKNGKENEKDKPEKKKTTKNEKGNEKDKPEKKKTTKNEKGNEKDKPEKKKTTKNEEENEENKPEKDPKDSPLFVVYKNEKKSWTIWIFLPKQGKILFKDPSGELKDELLNREIESILQKYEVVVNHSQDQARTEKSGVLTLLNLKYILKEFSDDFIEEFSDVEFFKRSDLDEIYLTYAVDLAMALSQNKEFHKDLNKALEQFPVDSIFHLDKFYKILKDETEDRPFEIKRIEDTKREFLGDDNMIKLNVSFDYLYANDAGVSLEQKFEKDFRNMQILFKLINQISFDSNFHVLFEAICEVLDLNYKKLSIFYEISKKDEKSTIRKKENKLKKITIIAGHLPPPRKTPPRVGRDVQTLEKLLDDVVVFKKNLTEQTKVEMDGIFQKIDRFYKNWQNKSCFDIYNWAKEKKNNEFEFLELIAVLDRGFQLLTTCRLRKCQILALLVMLNEKKQKGVLGEIKPKEGKSIIVALLAIIRVFQGHSVDIIEKDGYFVMDHQKLFDLFDVEIRSNERTVNFKVDVLVGSLKNFQMRFLEDESKPEEEKRKFDVVIFDEIDSLLVTNTTDNFAKLHEPFPGLDLLKYVYLNIWKFLHDAEEEYISEKNTKIRELMAIEDREQAELDLKELILESRAEDLEIIKDMVKRMDPANVPNLPPHLKSYINRKLDVWLESATFVKYHLQEKIHYRIIKSDKGEIVIPMNCTQISVKSKNGFWKDGVEQFLQLKHNLKLTPEPIPANFVTNFGYFQNYNCKDILGVTSSSQELLLELYEVNVVEIPPYKIPTDETIIGKTVKDEKWTMELVCDIRQKIEEKKAVLGLFENEKDILDVSRNLNFLQKNYFNLRIYTKRNNFMKIREELKIGDVVLMPYSVLRHVNLKISKGLKKNGNLEVFVGFLPCSGRIEEEIFERTKGATVQFLPKLSEIQKLDLAGKDSSFSSIIIERNGLEARNLKRVKYSLQAYQIKEKLYRMFYKYLEKIKQHKKRDIQEFFTFWIEEKNYTLSDSSPESEFDKFIKEAEEFLKDRFYNPLNLIELLNILLEDQNRDRGLKFVEKMKNILSHEEQVLPGLQLKFFEIYSRHDAAIAATVSKKLKLFEEVPEIKEFQEKATDCLKTAVSGLIAERNYLTENFFNKKGSHGMVVRPLKTNLLYRQLFARYQCILIHQTNIRNFIDKINEEEALLQGKEKTKIQALRGLHKLRLEDLQLIQMMGTDTYYSSDTPSSPPSKILPNVELRIHTAVSLAEAGTMLPMMWPGIAQRANRLMGDALTDLILSMFDKTEEYRRKSIVGEEFMKEGRSIEVFDQSELLKRVVELIIKSDEVLFKSGEVKSKVNKALKILEGVSGAVRLEFDLREMERLDFDHLFEKMNELGDDLRLEKFGGARKLKLLMDAKSSQQYKRILFQAKEPEIQITARILTPILKELTTKIFDTIFKILKSSKPLKHSSPDKLFNSKKYYRLVKTIVEKLKVALEGNPWTILADIIEKIQRMEIVTEMRDFLQADEELALKVTNDLAKIFFAGFEARKLENEEEIVDFGKLSELFGKPLMLKGCCFDFEKYFKKCGNKEELLRQYWKAKLVFEGNNENPYGSEVKEMEKAFGNALLQFQI